MPISRRPSIYGSPTKPTPLGPTDTSATGASAVTDMSNAFKDRTTFNEDISEWGVKQRDGHVHQKLGDWNVSAVTNMREMFIGACGFQSDDPGTPRKLPCIESWNDVQVFLSRLNALEAANLPAGSINPLVIMSYRIGTCGIRLPGGHHLRRIRWGMTSMRLMFIGIMDQTLIRPP